mgnify:FL=1
MRKIFSFVLAIKGRTTIELIRKDCSPLGLTISGGVDKDGKARVAQLKSGSIAQKSDVLEVGDILAGINGIKTSGLKHEQIIDLIKQVGDQLTLDIEYDLPKWRMYSSKLKHTNLIFRFSSNACKQYSTDKNYSNSIRKRRSKLWIYSTWRKYR